MAVPQKRKVSYLTVFGAQSRMVKVQGAWEKPILDYIGDWSKKI